MSNVINFNDFKSRIEINQELDLLELQHAQLDAFKKMSPKQRSILLEIPEMGDLIDSHIVETAESQFKLRKQIHTFNPQIS